MPAPSHASLLLIAAGLTCVVVAAGAMLLVGRALRAQMAAATDGGPRRDRSRAALTVSRGAGLRQSATVAASPPVAASTPATGVARTLAERGLVTARQLADMSPAEREFFLATMAAKLGDGRKPRLVPGAAAAGAAATAAQASDPIPQAALVSGMIHCPVCRAPIGQRTETPVRMSRCPGCSRRVGARVEGDRLTVTVDYTLGTPAAGAPKVNG